MAGLQRSAVSFRRQGSSGRVWDDRFFSGELKPTTCHELLQDDAVLRPSRSVGSVSSSFHRSRSSSAAHRMAVISPSPPPSSADPASPKFAGCGFCRVFGRPIARDRHQKSINRRSE
ncbi:uncharacterized protein At1g15400 [Momordica charantia]|uniref:Uncharacterized protein At1g15400 n=1 Tax=Momordica charantia TaxID=3673 RepID=A0A6J1CU40_MOMCH|nr:uncharacterized protein At1g15400 [Momordica charantia]